jgi:hypothetical protein
VISSGVRLRTKTGCLRNTALIACPGAICEMSISVELSASTSAEGAICDTSGTSTASSTHTGKAHRRDVDEIAPAHTVFVGRGRIGVACGHVARVHECLIRH